MKNVEFKNQEIKNNYQELIRNHRGLSGIILKLISEDNCIKITNIDKYEYGIQMNITANNKNIYIYTDFLKKKIYVDDPHSSRMEIYDDYPKKFISPVGYLYKNNNRSIIKRLTPILNPDKEKINQYDLIDNANNYVIIVDNQDGNFNEKDFIKNILYNSFNFDTIRGLFLAISQSINTKGIVIRICDSKGSIIILKDGKITEYLEYQEINDGYQKIYMEDHKFYIEKKVKEEYQDNLTSYVKKIGERNGKEKR